MAKLVRADVTSRARDAYANCGYIWGGYYGTRSPCRINSKGYGELGSGPYYATDCSGFTSWAWGIGYHAHSSTWGPNGTFSAGGRFHKRVYTTGDIETDFNGIMPGDVIWKNGHVVLYVGSNHTMEAATQHWSNTATQRGMVERTAADPAWVGYCSYDVTYSEDYDPELVPDIDKWNPDSGIDPGPAQPPYMDDEELYNMTAMLGNTYTRKYNNMKHWRRAK